MANKEKNSKIVNRIKFFVAENNQELEKKINRFYDESCGNFAGPPHFIPYPPANDGVKTVLMGAVEYSIRVLVVDEPSTEETAPESDNK